MEEGTTTTPFDMLMLNDLDRFHLVMDVIDRVPGLGEREAGLRQRMVDERLRLRAHTRATGEDHPDDHRLAVAAATRSVSADGPTGIELGRDPHGRSTQRRSPPSRAEGPMRATRSCSGVVADWWRRRRVVLVVADHETAAVRASWPDDRAGRPRRRASRRRCSPPSAARRRRDVRAPRRRSTPGVEAVLHAALAPGCDVPAAEAALGALARLLASHSARRSRAAHADDVRARMASLVDAGLSLGRELTLDDLLTRIVQSAREVLGARYAALGVLDADAHRARRAS